MTLKLDLIYRPKEVVNVKKEAMLIILLHSKNFLEYYTAITPTSLNTVNSEGDIRKYWVSLKKPYPKAKFSDVRLLMGSFASTGSILHSGDMVIGLEFIMKTEDSN